MNNPILNLRGIVRRSWHIVPSAALAAAGLIAVGCSSSGETTRAGGDRDRDREARYAAPDAMPIAIRRTAPEQIRVGEEFRYRITVENTSDQPLHNVVVHEIVDTRAPGSAQRQAARSVSRTDARGGGGSSERSASGQDNTLERWSEDDSYVPWSPDYRSNPLGRTGQAETIARQRDDARRPSRQQGTTRQTSARRDSEVQRRRSPTLEAGEYSDDSALSNRSRWMVGHLEPGEAKTVRVSAVADEGGTYHSCLMADYDMSFCDTIQAVAPNIQVRREIAAANVDEVYSCDDLEVTYTITNTGTAPLRSGTLREGRGTTINVGRIEPGETVTRTTTISLQGQDSYRARATLEAPGNVRIRSNTETVDVLNPELSLRVEGMEDAYVGETIEQTFTVRNISDDLAKNVLVRAEMPDSATDVEVQGAGIAQDGNVFRIGRLRPGQSRTGTIIFEIDGRGEAVTRLTADGYCVTEQTQTLRTDIIGIPAVLIEVVDKNDPVRVGEETVYEITVINQGSKEGLDIRLSTELPDTMRYVRTEGNRRATNDQGRVTFDPIPELAPGESETWNLHVRAVEAGRTRLEMQMTSTAQTRPIIEQEPTNFYE